MRILALGLTMGLLVGCTCAEQRQIASTEPVLGIGRYSLTYGDVELRKKVEAYYYPKRDATELAVAHLIEGYSYAEILALHGWEITDEKLKDETARIRTSSMEPKKLAEVESIFGGDEAAFRRVYVLPLMAERVLYYDFFQGNASIHEWMLRQANRLIERATKEPGDFEKLAVEMGGELTRFTVSRVRGIDWDAEENLPIPERISGHPAAESPEFQKKYPNYVDEEGDRWIREILGMLKRGEVHRKVVELPGHVLVVRLESRKGNLYNVQGARFRKVEYSEWLKKQRERVQVVNRLK